MKKLFTLLAGVMLALSAFAQAPELISYQAIVRDAENTLVTNQEVGIQLSIIQGSVFGESVYVETQTPTSNTNGLISLTLGSGTAVWGNFSTIDWSAGPYFIKTETDPAGGTNYAITGTSQLMSVPYSLHANTADTITGSIAITQVEGLLDSLTRDITIAEPTLDTLGLTAVLHKSNNANMMGIKNVADPIDSTDVATKRYVDQLLASNGTDTFATTLSGWEAQTLIKNIDARLEFKGFADLTTSSSDAAEGDVYIPTTAGNILGQTISDNEIGLVALRYFKKQWEKFIPAGEQVINAKNYNIKGDGTTDDTKAIMDLFNMANGQLIYFPPGRYVVDGSNILSDTVRFYGVMPDYVNGKLVNGTIFTGKVSFTGVDVHIGGFGVDLSSSSPDDGLRVTPTIDSGHYCSIENVITVGADVVSPFHSFLVEGFDFIKLSNIEIRDGYMGAVLKVKGGTIRDIRCFGNSREGIFLKSDNVYGNLEDLVIQGVYIENKHTGKTTGIKILSDGAQLQNVNVSNVFIKNVQMGISLISSGAGGVAVNNINLSNIKIENATLFPLYLEANAGLLYATNIANVDLTNVSNVLTTVGKVRYLNVNNLNANVKSNTNATNKNKIIAIGSDTKRTNFSNITVLRNFSEDHDLAINYENLGTENRITNHNLRLRGGVPQDGHSSVSISGTANKIEPSFNKTNSLSVIKLTPAAANAEVNAISINPHTNYSAELFPIGYELLILNDSEFDFTLKDNSTGGIINPDNQDVTVKSQTAVSYVFNGSKWIKKG